MKFELALSRSGLRIGMALSDAREAFGAETCNAVVNQHGVRLFKGQTYTFSHRHDKSPLGLVSLTEASPALIWVPDYHFAQMCVEWEEISPNVYLLKWPDPALCKPPRNITRQGCGAMTELEARAYLFELICEGNSAIYGNLIEDPAAAIDCLTSLTKKRRAS